MGIIVLAVAILPLLGIGGMQLYRAGAPGTVKDAKLAPRITETARTLGAVYAGLTAACAVALWAAGMPPFDAICHAFSTLALGGFSTHDANIAYFHSPLIELVLMLFMLIAAMNFATHFMALRKGDFKLYRTRPGGALDAAADARQLRRDRASSSTPRRVYREFPRLDALCRIQRDLAGHRRRLRQRRLWRLADLCADVDAAS